MTGMKASCERLIATAALLAAAGCAGEAAEGAKYAADDCRRVSLIDEATGQKIVGVEDFALDTAGERLFLSAYDRRAVEKAVRKKAFSVPEGGVYRLDWRAVVAGEREVAAAPIVRSADMRGGLRPHGIDYDAGAGEVVFINRAYQRLNGRWRMTASIERAGAEGEAFVGARAAAPCAANSVLSDSAGLLISYDHDACDWRAGLEDALTLKRSGVAAEDGYALFDKAAFANGVTRSDAGELVLAATREKSLLVLTQTAKGLAEDRRIDLPGGPDNLKPAEGHSVIAAVHPSLMRMGLHRRLGLGRAPSRIVRADLESGAVEILFDDPAGDLFSAATVAAERRGALVAGSVTEEGLLVCMAKA